MTLIQKPRGRLWRCASNFQQTANYRQIQFEDCVASADDDLLLDSDRARRKRRRIETLAERYFDGVALELSSVRPTSDVLKTLMKRSLRNGTLEDISSLDDLTGNKGSQLWEDVHDDWEVLDRFQTTGKASRIKRVASPRKIFKASAPPKGSRSNLADSDVKPKPPPHAKKPAPGLSHDALQKAAAIRERALRKSVQPGEITQLHSVRETYQPRQRHYRSLSPSTSSDDASERELSFTPTWSTSKRPEPSAKNMTLVDRGRSSFDGSHSKLDSISDTSNTRSKKTGACQPDNEPHAANYLDDKVVEHATRADIISSINTRSPTNPDPNRLQPGPPVVVSKSPIIPTGHGSNSTLQHYSDHSRQNLSTDRLSLPSSTLSDPRIQEDSARRKTNQQMNWSELRQDESELPVRSFSSFESARHAPKIVPQKGEGQGRDLSKVIYQLANQSTIQTLSPLDQALFMQSPQSDADDQHTPDHQRRLGEETRAQKPGQGFANPHEVGSRLKSVTSADRSVPLGHNVPLPYGDSRGVSNPATRISPSTLKSSPGMQTSLDNCNGRFTIRKPRAATGQKDLTSAAGSPNSTKPAIATTSNTPSTLRGTESPRHPIHNNTTPQVTERNSRLSNAHVHREPIPNSNPSDFSRFPSCETVDSLFDTHKGATKPSRTAANRPINHPPQTNPPKFKPTSARTSFRRDQPYDSDSDESVDRILSRTEAFLDQTDMEGILD